MTNPFKKIIQTKSVTKQLILSMGLLCLMFNVQAQHKSETDVDLTRVGKRIDSLLSHSNEDEPGVAIGLVKNNQLVYEKYFGLANLEYDAPIQAETSFHVASVSKQFTAFAILLLADEGKLSLEDDIRIYLPEMHDFKHTITIRHLLTHTSGLKDQFNLLRLSGWTLDDVITNKQVLEIIFNQETLNFNPNEQFMYSNSNYTLLAEIVARVSKKSFAAFTNQHIFKPLEMFDSKFVDQKGQVIKNKSLSYFKVDSVYVEDLFNNYSVGATNLNTTIRDLSKWAINYDTKQIGNEVIFNTMHTLRYLNNGETYGYAKGVFINTYRGFKRIEHSGQDASYQAYLATFPELNLSVIYTNTNGEINGARMVYDIMDIFLEPYVKDENDQTPSINTLTHQKPISKSALELRQYEGYYWDEGDWYSREIKVENDTLRFITKNGTTPLVPVGEHTIEMDIDDYVGITFTNNCMIITLDDGYQIYSEKYVPASYHSTSLKEFTGRYYSSELNTYYSFYSKENQLVAKHTRLGDFKLDAIKNDYFLGKKGSFLKVVFVRNSSDHVIGFEVSSSRATNVYFKKIES